MREMGPRLGDLHWKESTGVRRESKVLSEEAMGMLGSRNSEEAEGAWLVW